MFVVVGTSGIEGVERAEDGGRSKVEEPSRLFKRELSISVVNHTIAQARGRAARFPTPDRGRFHFVPLCSAVVSTALHHGRGVRCRPVHSEGMPAISQGLREERAPPLVAWQRGHDPERGRRCLVRVIK